MRENLQLKKSLIIQSFAPLFFILLIKYFKIEILHLLGIFFSTVTTSPSITVRKAIQHSLFINTILEMICLIWIIYSVLGILKFNHYQTKNFESQGESLTDIKKIENTSMSFFMTYILPLTLDNLDTFNGLLVFFSLLGIIFILMWKTNLYYQNPILTILGYDIFSFQFETTQIIAYQDKHFIGITREIICENKSIKRQKIADNVFLIYKEE